MIRWSKRIRNPRPFDKWMARNFIMVFMLPLFSYDKWQFLVVLFSYLNYVRFTKQQSKWEKENDNKCIRCGHSERLSLNTKSSDSS